MDTILRSLVRGFARLLMRLALRIDIEGWENLPPAGPLLVIANHFSLFEAPILMAFLPYRDRITWLAATRLKPDAVIGYYGGGIHGTRNEKPGVPTMLHFGDKDMHIPMAHVNELRSLHPGVTIYDYPADHGFHCDERGSYDAPASKQAYARTLEFMAKHVG